MQSIKMVNVNVSVATIPHKLTRRHVDHFDGLHEQLNNAQAGLYVSPTFRFARGITDIDDFKYEDFIIDGYKSWPTIKMDVAV